MNILRTQTQPRYASNAPKFLARQRNVDVYRELTGITRLPANRQYWTLSNDQPDEPGSEINQLVGLGFLRKNQFHGVDHSLEITRRNKLTHPTAHWYAGSWQDVIAREAFLPGMIYLDTIHFADNRETLRLLASTMMLSLPGTVLLVNAIDASPHAKHRIIKSAELVRHLVLPEVLREDWNDDVPSFTYRSRFTGMRTFIFYKRG